MTENTNPTPMQASEDTSNAPMAATDTCEHFYSTRLLGGHPLHVRVCQFCRVPDWGDLREQADGLYRWGWNEGREGKPMRTHLSAYDRPRTDEEQA